MDFVSSNDREIVIDIEGFIDTSTEVRTPSPAEESLGNAVTISVCGMPVSVDESIRGENCINLNTVDEISSGTGKNSKREKGKAMSKKKPSKPPRPPRGLSLDAADQKLIKEISELAMIKRAKIERMKVLKKMKAAKASSSSTSSGGNLMAILFTIIFFIVIILQGCRSSGVSHTSKSAVPTHGSLESSTVAAGNVRGVPLTSIGSPKLIMQPVPGPDIAKPEAAEKSVR